VNGEAVRRYKELADRNTDAVRRMREHDRAVAEQLRKQLGAADLALFQSFARERMSTVTVRMHWDSVVETLWAERWLSIGPPPDPIPPPPGMTPDQADAEVERTYDALRDALGTPGVLSRLRRQD
jgi:hypothetical protein